jgi:amino acid transporter
MASSPEQLQLRRQLDWKDAFWASSGVPAGVLLTMGGIAATIGQPSWVIWIASILMGFMQSFVYAEIAGLYPNKSGGASVYGAAGWLPYGKFIAPISVWCNWLAWSPVLALGTSLGAGYVMASLFEADSAIRTWQITLFDLGMVREGLTLRINLVSLIATGFLLLTFALQHHGAARAANFQKVLGLLCMTPLLLVGLVPFLTGDLPTEHLFPLLPMIKDAAGNISFGSWDALGLTLLAGAMFGAGWSTYGFETAVCYTREFRDPARDTARALFAAGLLCMAIFVLVPLAFQASLGLEGMLDPAIYDGSGVAKALAQIVGGGAVIGNLLIVMLILALLLIVMTSMLAHALPGLGRWLAAALPVQGQPARRADRGDVDRPWVQPDPAARLGLFRGADDEQRLLLHLQLPQFAGRVDPPDRPQGLEAALSLPDLAAGAGGRAGLRQHGVDGRGRRRLGRGDLA